MAERLELVAHRGGPGLFPENTLAAFRAAIALGVDALELDVAVTKDAVPVVSHDPCLQPDITRSPDGAWLTAPTSPIGALRFADLAAFDVGRILPGSAYAAQFPRQQPRDGERIPSLAQVFALAPSIRFYVELKTFPDRPELTVAPDAMAELVVATAAATGASERLVVESFDWRGLRHLSRHHPGIARGYITGRPTEADQRLWWEGTAAADYAGSVPRALAPKAAGPGFPSTASCARRRWRRRTRSGCASCPGAPTAPMRLRGWPAGVLTA